MKGHRHPYGFKGANGQHFSYVLLNKEWLTEQYTERGRSCLSISQEIGCCSATVFNTLKRLGIPRRKPGSYKRPLGTHSPKWKGGRSLQNNGYVATRDALGKRCLEHRLVMSRILGRPLLRTEIVHHLNGERADNRPSNLKLVSNLENLACIGCGLQKEVRLLKWQIRKLQAEVGELRQLGMVR